MRIGMPQLHQIDTIRTGDGSLSRLTGQLMVMIIILLLCLPDLVGLISLVLRKVDTENWMLIRRSGKSEIMCTIVHQFILNISRGDLRERKVLAYR